MASIKTMVGGQSDSVTNHLSLIRPKLPAQSLTANQSMVLDFADVIGVPPVEIGQDYSDKCGRVAALLGLPSRLDLTQRVADNLSPGLTVEKDKIQRALPNSPSLVSPYVSVNVPRIPTAPTDTNSAIFVKNEALSFRNDVFDFINKAGDFVARASNAGFSPPDNPFVAIANLDAQRQVAVRASGAAGSVIDVDSSLADDLVFNIGAYVQLLVADSQGTLNLSQTTNVAAQLNGFTISLDGYGSGGNVATDLMRFLPNADEVRAQKDLDLLAAFDFRKRVPTIVFTADYDNGTGPGGSVVGWKRIPDASGYVIKRRNVFDNTEKSVQVSNDDLKSALGNLRDYLNAYVMSFYDTLDVDHIWAYVDTSLDPDQYYLYSVQAYQVHNDSKDQVFNVDMIPSSFSSAIRNKVSNTLADLAHQYFGPSATADDINPWPVVSLQLYGDSQFDWILAAVNSRASVNRSDGAPDTRRFSYLGARFSHLLDFMDKGVFVVPKNVNDVIRNVNSSVTSFGVSQTIAEILHETGILYYFEGVDQKNPSGFNRAGNLNIGASSLLSGIIAAVDPETATLELSSLGVNMSQILSNTQFSNDPAEVTGLKLRSDVSSNVHASAQEINVPDPDQTDKTTSQGDLQFANKISTSSDVLDLTSFEGLSGLTRAIRLFADEGPGRGGGDVLSDSLIPPVNPVTKIEQIPQSIYALPIDSVGVVSGIKVIPPQSILAASAPSVPSQQTFASVFGTSKGRTK